MPIIRDSAPMFDLDLSTRLCRYMDLTKFLSLLQSKQLFFCRLDRLEDPFEGSIPSLNKKLLEDWISDLERKKIVGVGKENQVEVLEKYHLAQKQVTCVSCWNKYRVESMALWKIYSDSAKGIMILSSVERLERALKDSREEVRISEVQYRDYTRETIPVGNVYFPIIHKQRAYDYENEVRLIYEIEQAQIGKVFDWSKQPIEQGVRISADLDTLIEEIVVGPSAPDWYREMVIDLAEKYGLTSKVRPSELRRPFSN